jgi:nitroimidazol reductase NimA-like FMN-containing flavoprotein (pyridoxamine 5'-phosphate oxidase superfamily)
VTTSFAMSPAERQAFLQGVHVGIIGIADGARGPLTVPVWYAYEPGGDILVITERSSRKGQLIEQHRRFSLCVQIETPPYRYVTVEGPVVAVEPVDVERQLRPMARRYLGAEGGDRYIERTVGPETPRDTVSIRMRPERWLSVDYGKRDPQR